MGVTLKKCMTCRQRAVSQITLPLYSTEMEHDGRKYPVEVIDFQVLKCGNCDSIVLDDTATGRLFDALRSAAGLLAPSEIRRQREALGLKQRELANLLQISESTLSRWETGAQMQQKCMDKFLRGFFAVKELRRFLGMTWPIPTIFAQQPLGPSRATQGIPLSSPPIAWPGSVEIDFCPSAEPFDPKLRPAA